MTKIAVIFDVNTMQPASYRQALKDLEAAGAGHPPGRLSHVATTTDKGMIVVDTYDSLESFQKFGETLVPILIKNGINPPDAKVLNIENEIYPPVK